MKTRLFSLIISICVVMSVICVPTTASAANEIPLICNKTEIANYSIHNGTYDSNTKSYLIHGVNSSSSTMDINTGWLFYPDYNRIVFYQEVVASGSYYNYFLTTYIDNSTQYNYGFSDEITDRSLIFYGYITYGTATINANNYHEGDNINFTLKGPDSNLYSSISRTANTMAKGSFELWNMSLLRTVGLNIGDIGFTSYTTPTYKELNTGHWFGDWATVQAATEDKEGIQERTCKYCGAKEQKTNPATGHIHKMIKTAAKEPTCTEPGNNEYYTCSKCGRFYADELGAIELSPVNDTVNGIPAKGHSYGEWTIKKEATESSEGEKIRTCKTCGNIETRTIPKKGEENAKTDNPADVLAEIDDNEEINKPEGNTDKTNIETDSRPNTDSLFVDVTKSNYYYDAANWAAKTGVTAGIDATHFGPNQQCTRAQVMTFLWKANGSPEPKTTKNPFTDVKTSNYYYKPVLWAVENGITTGTSATTFSPNAACTRGQVVTFLWHANGDPEDIAKSNPFGDVKSINYYYKPVLWAMEHGITSGTTENSFSPNQTCTRAQIVTFIWKSKGSPLPQ